jgi:hypothetical protein
MKTITPAELVEKIKAINGNVFVTLETITDAKAKKTGNPFGTILKQSIAHVAIGHNYQNAVNAQGKREENENAGEFVAQPLPWGEWLVPNRLIGHKGEIYVRTQTNPSVRFGRPAKVQYRDTEGKFLSREAVKPHLPVKAESARQAAFGNEGKIEVRTLKLSSIRRIRIAGETLTVK